MTQSPEKGHFSFFILRFSFFILHGFEASPHKAQNEFLPILTPAKIPFKTLCPGDPPARSPGEPAPLKQKAPQSQDARQRLYDWARYFRPA